MPPLERDLGLGDTGPDVSYMQEVVLGMKPSGVYCKDTVANVKRWQGKNRLPTTGYFGPLSRKAAANAVKGAPGSANTSQTRVVVAGPAAPAASGGVKGVSLLLAGAVATGAALGLFWMRAARRNGVSASPEKFQNASGEGDGSAMDDNGNAQWSFLDGSRRQAWMREAAKNGGPAKGAGDAPATPSAPPLEQPGSETANEELVPEASQLSQADRVLQLTLSYAQRKEDSSGGVSTGGNVDRSMGSAEPPMTEQQPRTWELPRNRADILAESYAARRALNQSDGNVNESDGENGNVEQAARE